MEERKEPFDPFIQDQLLRPERNRENQQIESIQAIQSRYHEIRGWGHRCDPEYDIQASLEELENSLMKLEENAKCAAKEAGMQQWWFWYFSACIHLIRQDQRAEVRDRKADGAYVIHPIVNGLLETEGVKPFAVIAALAEQDHRLSVAAYASHDSQMVISALVAAGLRQTG